MTLLEATPKLSFKDNHNFCQDLGSQNQLSTLETRTLCNVLSMLWGIKCFILPVRLRQTSFLFNTSLWDATFQIIFPLSKLQTFCLYQQRQRSVVKLGSINSKLVRQRKPVPTFDKLIILLPFTLLLETLLPHLIVSDNHTESYIILHQEQTF